MKGPIKHKLVKDLMTARVIAIQPETPFKDIVALMREHGISALPVVDPDQRVLGIVSEADLLLKEEREELEERHLVEGTRRRLERRKATGYAARDLMTAPAITIPPSAPAAAAASLMHSRRIKRLPVVDEDGRLVGIVSRTDLLKLFLRVDEEIKKEVLRDVVVGTLWLEPDGIEIDVTDGVVTFTGEVSRFTDSQIIARLTLGLDGVVGVVNRLRYRVDDSKPARVVESTPGMFSRAGRS
jgi:CBS-domain-containing membrane protein